MCKLRVAHLLGREMQKGIRHRTRNPRWKKRKRNGADGLTYVAPLARGGSVSKGRFLQTIAFAVQSQVLHIVPPPSVAATSHVAHVWGHWCLAAMPSAISPHV